MRSLVFIILALLFLGSAGYLGHKYLYKSVEGTTPVAIVTAKAPSIWALELVKDVARGDILEKEHVQWQPLPEGWEGGYLLRRENPDLADWQNSAFARSLKKGNFLQDMDLVRPTETSYLKTLLPEGMRARPVAIDNLGDFKSLHPGVHVDLILTYATPSHSARAGETVVKTILENIRVIGLDQSEGKGPARALTLALSPEEVELASMAEAVGKLRISLHGGTVAKKADTPIEKAAFSASDFFPDLKPAPVSIIQDQSRDIRIMRGGDTSVITLKPTGIK